MGLISSLAQKLGFSPAGTLEERKAKYHQVLMKAMEDGVLTDDEIEELDTMRKQLGLKEDDVRGMRMKAFQKAVEVVKADGLFTPKEERDLEKIKGYLGVVENAVAKDRHTLAKMRVLYEVHRGNLPIDEIPGLGLDPGEQCHISVGATLHEAPKDAKILTPAAGPNIAVGKPFKMGAGRVQPLPEADLTLVTPGSLTITTHRLMFNSGKTAFRLRYDKLQQIVVFADGLIVTADTGGPRIIKLKDNKDLELIAAIVSRYLNPPPPKAGDKAKPEGQGTGRINRGAPPPRR